MLLARGGAGRGQHQQPHGVHPAPLQRGRGGVLQSPDPPESFAGRWAAKEATIKAIIACDADTASPPSCLLLLKAVTERTGSLGGSNVWSGASADMCGMDGRVWPADMTADASSSLSGQNTSRHHAHSAAQVSLFAFVLKDVERSVRHKKWSLGYFRQAAPLAPSQMRLGVGDPVAELQRYQMTESGPQHSQSIQAVLNWQRRPPLACHNNLFDACKSMLNLPAVPGGKDYCTLKAETNGNDIRVCSLITSHFVYNNH